jgi:hypothetical protein
MTRALLAISGPLTGLSHALEVFWHNLAARWAGYRPERHYMRGPGPAWHAKHGQPPA